MGMSLKQRLAAGFGREKGTLCGSVGSVRSGKTYSSVWGFGFFTQSLRRPYLHLLMGRRLKTIEVELLPHFRDLARVLDAPYHYVQGSLTIGVQRYQVFAGNDERSPGKIQGLTIHSALLDEATLVPQAFFEMALSRLTHDDSKFWLCMNPAGPFHYLKADWIDQGRWDRALEFDLDDNPTLGEATKTRLRTSYSGVFHARMIKGLWAEAEGLIYSDWSSEKVDYNIWRVLDARMGIDYGVSSPSAFVVLQKLVAKIEGRRVIRFHAPLAVRTKVGPNSKPKTDRELVEMSLPIADLYNCSSLVHDPSASSLVAEYRAYFREVRRRRLRVIKANNDVIAGIRTVGNCLARKLITVGEDCADLEKEFEGYSWGDNEQPVKQEDHACDGLRYVAMDMCQRYSTGDPILLPKGM